MNSVGKWKLATYMLAATTAMSLYRGGTSVEDASGSVEPARHDASYQRRMSSLARLRIPAALAGVDEKQLLRDLAAARSTQQGTLICERLGIFGTDFSLEPLETLSVERPQLASAAIMAMGGIGTDRATDRLITMVGGGAAPRSYWAVRALAKTRNPRASAQLMDWAEGGNRRLRHSATEALGQVGGDEVLEILHKNSRGGDTELIRRSLLAAAAMGTDDAIALVQEIADRGNRDLRLTALRSFPSSLSTEQQDWLMNVLATSDQESASAAAEALGRAHATDALPLLLDAARTGAPSLRRGAVRALASIGGDEALAVIEELFPQAGQQTAYDLGRALLDAGGENGKSVFLKAMREGHSMRPQLIQLLGEMSGKGVDELRLHIAREGSPRERQAVLSQLVGSDDEQVIELMLELAQDGPQNTRHSALNLLAASSSPRALAALNDIARQGGRASLDALNLLGARAGSDPEAEGILIDALYSGRPNQMRTASWALANAGTPAGREALMSAVESGDRALASAAMAAVGQLGNTPEVVETLKALAASSDDPQLRSSARYQLVNSGAPESTALVLDAIRDGDPGANNLLSSLITRGGAGAQEVIDEAARSESASTRAAVAGALTQRADAESVALLDKLTRDDDTSVQSAAIYAMASIGSRESIDRLMDIARDGESDVRSVALSMVGNSGDPRATTLITDAIRSGDDQLAQTAISSAYNAGPAVDAALRSLLESSDAASHLRRQAANALVNRGAEVDPELLESLQGAGDLGATGYLNDYEVSF